MKHFFVGAGDYGKELFYCSDFYDPIVFSGFVDIKKKKNILLIDDFLKFKKKVHYTITIGDSKKRHEIFNILKKNKFLINKKIIFRSVNLSKNVLIGDGSILMHNVYLANNVLIGKNCHIQGNSIVGHDCHVDNNVTIGAGVFIGGHSRIGSGAVVHPNSVILKNTIIGKNCSVGSGSVVFQNLPDNTSVFGVPAKRLI
jgi:sugar O-acyltransferase (sialic acid O-acetyltransferase NeuD family)